MAVAWPNQNQKFLLHLSPGYRDLSTWAIFHCFPGHIKEQDQNCSSWTSKLIPIWDAAATGGYLTRYAIAPGPTLPVLQLPYLTKAFIN